MREPPAGVVALERPGRGWSETAAAASPFALAIAPPAAPVGAATPPAAAEVPLAKTKPWAGAVKEEGPAAMGLKEPTAGAAAAEEVVAGEAAAAPPPEMRRKEPMAAAAEVVVPAAAAAEVVRMAAAAEVVAAWGRALVDVFDFEVVERELTEVATAGGVGSGARETAAVVPEARPGGCWRTWLAAGGAATSVPAARPGRGLSDTGAAASVWSPGGCLRPVAAAASLAAAMEDAAAAALACWAARTSGGIAPGAREVLAPAAAPAATPGLDDGGMLTTTLLLPWLPWLPCPWLPLLP